MELDQVIIRLSEQKLSQSIRHHKSGLIVGHQTDHRLLQMLHRLEQLAQVLIIVLKSSVRMLRHLQLEKNAQAKSMSGLDLVITRLKKQIR